jgi:hypothetical protein
MAGGLDIITDDDILRRYNDYRREPEIVIGQTAPAIMSMRLERIMSEYMGAMDDGCHLSLVGDASAEILALLSA